MNQYRSLLILGIGTTLLTGCMPSMEDSTTLEKTPSSCQLSNHLSFSTHLKPSRHSINAIHVESVSATIEDNASLIKYIKALCDEKNVPNDIAFIPVLTSGYNPLLEHKGQVGLWQISPVMAQNLSLNNNYWLDARKDIIASSEAVIAYMKFLHYKLDQDWTLALAAYYGGLQPVLDAVHYNKSKGLSIELQHLDIDSSVKEQIHSLEAVLYLAQHINIDSAKDLHVVHMPGQIELAKLSALSGSDLDRLHYLNAGCKRRLTNPDGPHHILVDENDYASILHITKNINQLRQVSTSNWETHVVKKNESLSHIAHKFDTQVSEIKRANHLTSDMIQINQKLIIPEHNSHQKQHTIQPNNHPGAKRILHTVASKDTLYHLATQYKVTIAEIIHWNSLHHKSIQPNQVITLWQYTPVDTAQFYTVKQNDSLSSIARAHKVSVQSLQKANQLNNTVIHPKERLLIPKKS